MDDLKVVFYVIVAIVWMIYNNYKKVSDTAKKRDITKPYEETIPENWPAEPVQPKPQVPSKQRDTSARKAPATIQPSMRKAAQMKREAIRKEPMSKKFRPQPAFLTSREGGTTQPSKIVQFEDATIDSEPINQFAEDIRNADFRKGIVIAEVLQRPYI